MCNCLKEKKQLAIDSAEEQISSLKGWIVQDVEFKHTTEIFASALNLPIIIKGLNSKGNKAKKELYYPVIYCPFCGEKL
jgi:hypothetical protein